MRWIHHAEMLLDRLAKSQRADNAKVFMQASKSGSSPDSNWADAVQVTTIFLFPGPSKKYIVCAISTLFARFCNFTL